MIKAILLLLFCAVLLMIFIFSFCLDRSKQYKRCKKELPIIKFIQQITGRTPQEAFVNNSGYETDKQKITRKKEWITVKSRSLFHGDFDYNIEYCEDTGKIEITFQCTNGWRDWISNLDFPCRPYSKISYRTGNKINHVRLWVHRGWMKMYRLGKKDIRAKFSEIRKLHPKSDIVVYGYSLGGAMAQLCCQDLNYNFNEFPILITFGSPRPWFGKKTDRYVSRCIDIDKSYQFENVNDIVSVVPPFMNWRKMKSFVVGLDKFNFFKLFNPWKYHTSYNKEEVYM